MSLDCSVWAGSGELWGGLEGSGGLWRALAGSGMVWRVLEGSLGISGELWKAPEGFGMLRRARFKPWGQIYTIFLQFQECASYGRRTHFCSVQLQLLLQNSLENQSIEKECCRSCRSDFRDFRIIAFNFPYRRRLRIEFRNFGPSHGYQSNEFSEIHMFSPQSGPVSRGRIGIPRA